MKTSKTRVSSIALLLLTVCMVIGLASCNLVSNLICQHQWKDATCTTPKTCSLCQKTEGEALGHSGGTATCSQKAVCSVCNTEYGDFAAHAFTEEVVKDEALKSSATCTSAAIYYKSCTCGAVSTNDADIFQSGRIGRHQYEGNICSICGFDAGDSYYYNFVESIVTTNRISLKIDNFVYEIKTNKPSPSGIQKINSVNVAELELYYEDGKLGGAAHGTINATYFGSVKQSGEFSAVISDNYLYFYATDGSDQNLTYKVSLEEVLNQYLENIMYNDLEKNIEFLSFITDTVLPVIEILAEGNRTDINKLLERTLTALFTFEKQADGSVLVKPNKDKALALNQALATQTIAEIIDTYYGNDAFDGLVDFTYEILDMKLSEIPDYVKDKGVDYDDFIAKLQDLIHVFGAPEEGEEGYVDINEQITNSEYSDTILGNLITNADDYKAEFEKHVWSELRATTFYEVQGYEKEDQAEIDDAITEIFKCLNASCTTNSAGEFTAINASLNASNSSSDSSETAVTTEVFITCSFEILADGQINVTWGNIVDDYNNAVAPIPDSLKENAEFDIDNYDQERITVEFKNQLFYCSTYSRVEVSKPNYDVAILSGIASNCGDWNNYIWNLTQERYSYEIYFKKDSNIIFLRWDYYSVVQLTPIIGGFCVTYEDGTTKDLMVETADKDMVKLAADLLPQIYDNFEPNDSSKTVTYYYNTVTKEYAYEEQHDWTYTYNKFGDDCSDGYEYTRICSKCNAKVVGYNDYHDYETTEVDLKELGLCGGTIIIQKCRACDYSSMYNNGSDCDWNWINTSDGYDTYQCADCGAIRKRQSTYDEKVEGCEYQRTETYIYTLNGVEVFNHTTVNTYTNHSNETSYELFGKTCADGYKQIYTCKDCGYSYSYTYDHDNGHSPNCYSQIIETIDLSTLGMCGGYINKYACERCDTDMGADISDYYCNWLLQSEDSDGYSVYKCHWCNAIKKEKITTTKDEDCNRTETTERIYLVNGEEIYREENISSRNTEHNYEYSFEMDGATCEDGYKMTRICKDCGDNYSGRRYGHYTENEHTDLRELGLCGGYTDAYHCVVPGCTYVPYSYIRDYDCSWQLQGETDGYTVYKCSECNTVKKIKSTESEMGENCEYTEIQEYIYIVNGTEVYHTEMSYNRTNHVGEYSYEFYDGTCENGYIKTEICTKCGCVMYSSEYTYHDTLWDSVYLRDLGMCGGYVQKRYCSICNTVENIDVNDHGCYWEKQEDDSNGYSVYKCSWCNAIKKVKATETEKDDNCQYTRIVEYIFIVNGKEVYRIEDSNTYSAHEYEYSYEMHGATCNDGYKVMYTCTGCGYSNWYTSSGHDTERETIYLSNLGLCGGYIEEYHCQICDTVTDVYRSEYCSLEFIYNDPSGYSVYKCNGCGAIWMIKESSNEYSIIIQKDGTGIYKVSYTY